MNCSAWAKKGRFVACLVAIAALWCGAVPARSALAAPGALTVTAADMANNLTWTKPYVRPGTRLASYAIVRATSRKGPFALAGTRSSRSRSFVDRVSTARPYFYQARAVSDLLRDQERRRLRRLQ